MESDERQPIPYLCQSDMVLHFKQVVKNIADDIDKPDKLMFMCDMMYKSFGIRASALDILWKQVEKGKFAHDNIQPLECLLTDIDRCDLITKHIDPYKQKYGEHTERRGKFIAQRK